MQSKHKLLRITTVPISLKLLLRGQLSFMQREGYTVLAVSAAGTEIQSLTQEGIVHKTVMMTRKITPVQDLISLIQLVWVMLKFRPDIVHTHTPKAGLLGMLAASICRVPLRLHTVAGLPLMEAQGLKRKLLMITEKITYVCAHRVYPNSQGLLNFINSEFNLSSAKFRMLGKGSSNGIDTSFFKRTQTLDDAAVALRLKYDIQQNDIVFSFVGRIVNDKGIVELIKAFKEIENNKCEETINLWRDGVEHLKSNTVNKTGRTFLLLIGPFEQSLDPLSEDDYKFLHEHPNVIIAGFQNDVRPWILASDVFVFPSYREGFPNVVMQACCLEVPCIVSDINGCNEIIQHGETGLIVPPKNSAELYEAMCLLRDNSEERKRYGQKARQFVVKNFDQQYVWEEILKEYKRA